jgi:hypothetical protein
MPRKTYSIIPPDPETARSYLLAKLGELRKHLAADHSLAPQERNWTVFLLNQVSTELASYAQMLSTPEPLSLMRKANPSSAPFSTGLKIPKPKE